jgi:hypothetical protein
MNLSDQAEEMNRLVHCTIEISRPEGALSRPHPEEHREAMRLEGWGRSSDLGLPEIGILGTQVG